MPRVIEVQKAQESKVERRCFKCGHVIAPGERYRHWSRMIGGRGRKFFGCVDHRPRASDLTGSDKLSQIYAAVEGVEDTMSSWDEQDVGTVVSALNDAAENVREASEGYTESADNMEQAFTGGSAMIDEIREKAEQAENFADALESAANDLEEFDEDGARDEAVGELGEFEDWAEQNGKPVEVGEDDDDDLTKGTTPAVAAARQEYEDALTELVDEKRSTWAEEIADKVEEAIGENEL